MERYEVYFEIYLGGMFHILKDRVDLISEGIKSEEQQPLDIIILNIICSYV